MGRRVGERMIYKWLAIAALATLIGYFIFDKGVDYCNAKHLRTAAGQAETNIEIERQQNEVRSVPLSDTDFLDVLRHGRFGR